MEVIRAKETNEPWTSYLKRGSWIVVIFIFLVLIDQGMDCLPSCCFYVCAVIWEMEFMPVEPSDPSKVSVAWFISAQSNGNFFLIILANMTPSFSRLNLVNLIHCLERRAWARPSWMESFSGCEMGPGSVSYMHRLQFELGLSVWSDSWKCPLLGSVKRDGELWITQKLGLLINGKAIFRVRFGE